jgi:hypothetical protein
MAIHLFILDNVISFAIRCCRMYIGKLIDWLIDYCFPSRSRIFHLYGDVTIAGEGLQNLGLCSVLRAFDQGGIFIVPHLLWHGTSVFPGLIRRTAQVSRLLRHAWGCGGPIITRFLTGHISKQIPEYRKILNDHSTTNWGRTNKLSANVLMQKVIPYWSLTRKNHKFPHQTAGLLLEGKTLQGITL